MSLTARPIFFYTDAFQGYDMGSEHPLKPLRLRKTYELLRDYGALEAAVVEEPTPCTVEDLLTTHSAEFVQAVEMLNDTSALPHSYRRYGFGSGDNPLFPNIFDASCLYTGASLNAAQAVVEDRAPIAVNISGGLHHAHYARAAGFCVFNDCAVALHRLRERFARVAYVDIDVHHGDGVQELFYDDPSVLTISIHETGRTLFPGTGFVAEVGEGAGTGYSINVPVWPNTSDEQWLRAWRTAALPILRAFAPEAIVLQMGADAHVLDPLAHVALTAQGWLEAVRDVKALGVPLVVVGGGGYNQTTVPRMWTLACAELFGLSLPDDTPNTYRWHTQIPALTDHKLPVVSPEAAEQAETYNQGTIEEVRQTLFGYHGLK